MAIGLSRTKNLSERNLNLKTAIQKLYSPGIDADIALFSLSSSLESRIVSGTADNSNAQIFGIRDESLSSITGEVKPRTKFLTNFFTLTDLNEVYFSKYTLNTPAAPGRILPKSSGNGELHQVEIIAGGLGFYFERTNGSIFSPPGVSFEVRNVPLRGLVSGRVSARATITFTKHSVINIPEQNLLNFTAGSTDRYTVSSVKVNNPSTGYIFPENIELELGNAQLVTDGSAVVIKKQPGVEFSGYPEILKSKIYTYEIRGANTDGFFVYDPKENNYIYLARNILGEGFSEQEANSLELRRFDGINVNNFLQFKFAQSRIWLQKDDVSDTAGFKIEGGSISQEINRIASITNDLQSRMRLAIQNTRGPTEFNSLENILGYKYNSFEGQDLVIWQRVILRDPDYVLDSTNPSITGTRLRTSTSNFQLTDLSNPGEKIRVPGLFIKVGNQYLRAFSTTDKPFFAETSLRQILNPVLSSTNASLLYSISAESLRVGSDSQLYSYNTTIADFAQRIDPNGANGAFYYHRTTAIISREIPSGSKTVFATPLFRYF
jgi:hypothetical protein